MHPGVIAAAEPEKTAYIMAESGRKISYKTLNDASNRGARLFRHLGLKPGDHIAILLENHEKFFQICWAAQRAGLYYTAISWRLQSGEVEYIVNNCKASVFITSAERRDVVEPLLDKMPDVKARYVLDGEIEGFSDWDAAIGRMPNESIADEIEGSSMLYSSGTTGYPKGVKKPLGFIPFGQEQAPNLMEILYGANTDSIYLSPAPLYHAAPLAFTMGCLRHGTCVVVMEHFDAELALKYIDQYKITHSQWVPTMFVRMLKLPESVRSSYDVSSLKCAIHAAAPCPVPVKEQMIAWWGKIVFEYYAGTEGNGFVQCNSEEWLAHKGTVGKALTCEIYICDEQGQVLPVGESGTIYLAGGGDFEYHGDEKKTADSRHSEGWTTLGDLGYLDEEGYLYLTDRKHFMIISGGVNIYPQEAENALVTHPDIVDVAVFGVPNPDFGEEVKAVVQPVDMSQAGPELELKLMAYCRDQLSAIKCPRSIDFIAEIPRHPTGKLYKRLLKDKYWADYEKEQSGARS